MIDHGKRNLLGIRIDALDYEAAVLRVIDAAHANRDYAISGLALHGLMSDVGSPPESSVTASTTSIWCSRTANRCVGASI